MRFALGNLGRCDCQGLHPSLFVLRDVWASQTIVLPHKVLPRAQRPPLGFGHLHRPEDHCCQVGLAVDELLAEQHLSPSHHGAVIREGDPTVSLDKGLVDHAACAAQSSVLKVWGPERRHQHKDPPNEWTSKLGTQRPSIQTRRHQN